MDNLKKSFSNLLDLYSNIEDVIYNKVNEYGSKYSFDKFNDVSEEVFEMMMEDEKFSDVERCIKSEADAHFVSMFMRAYIDKTLMREIVEQEEYEGESVGLLQ